MATVLGVRFKKAGKVYYFDPTGVWPNPGDCVIVETSRGIELGQVISGAREVGDEHLVAPLKKVLRLATDEDIQRAEYNKNREPEAMKLCQEKIAEHNLDMKLIDVEFTFDSGKVIFYFTANGRIDFRDLVKDLAGTFKTRIELRQIGVRDEAKMLGGLGCCGRQLCCDAFLGDFQPVSIKMAKEQGLSLNPTKISGQCGRLMCCLKYEQDYYEKTLKRLPKIGREAMTPDGPGYITEINVIREKVRVRMHNDDDTFEIREYALDDVSKIIRADGEAPSPKYVEKPRRPRPAPDAEEKPAPRRFASNRPAKQQSAEHYLDNLASDSEAESHAPEITERAEKDEKPREKNEKPRPAKAQKRARPARRNDGD